MDEASRWICYILECADGTLYTGIARDVDARLSRHNRGLASKCTRARRPVRIVHREGFPDRASASRREAQIKGMARKDKLALAGLPARKTR